MIEIEAIRTAFEPDEDVDGNPVRIGHYQEIVPLRSVYYGHLWGTSGDWSDLPRQRNIPLYRGEKVLVIEPK